MVKIDKLCSFTHGCCQECALYRGRHHYMGSCQHYRGYLGESKESTASDKLHELPSFNILDCWMEPWANDKNQWEIGPEFRLRVVDMESGTVKLCDLDEAKTWDWSNPEIMRLINGLQIISWDKLVDIVRYKAKKGYHEVEIYETPRVMMLGGG